MKMDSSVALWFVRTLNECQGSMDPVMANENSNDLSRVVLTT